MAKKLTRVKLRQKEVVYKPNQPIDHVLFPEDAILCLMTLMSNGDTIEASTVGREGASWISASVASPTMPCETIVAIEGTALSLPIADLDRERKENSVTWNSGSAPRAPVCTTSGGWMSRSAAVAMLVWSLWAIPCRAQDSPEGAWKTIDDRRGTERSLVRIRRDGDELRGKVEHVFPRVGEPAHPLCELCPGEKKNKPIEGLEILWGFRQRDGEWAGGWVLDPEEGKTYKCKIRLSEGGRKLVVRGYVGLSMFGRSQTWVRMK